MVLKPTEVYANYALSAINTLELKNELKSYLKVKQNKELQEKTSTSYGDWNNWTPTPSKPHRYIPAKAIIGIALMLDLDINLLIKGVVKKNLKGAKNELVR